MMPKGPVRSPAGGERAAPFSDAQAVIDLLPDLILLVDGDGTILAGNAALCRALRLTRAAVIGHRLYDLIDMPAERAAQYLRRCSASRQPLPGTLVFRRPDGTRLDCRCDGARTLLRDGDPGAVLLHCRPKSETVSGFVLLNRKLAELTREIAARRAAEEALRGLAETLEQRVAERTQRLTAAHERLIAESAERRSAETALYEAQKMEAVGRLTGGVAHDFNNLLTVVLGALETLEHEIGGGRLGHLVQSARRAALRGAELTTQLLAFSRKQMLKPQPTDINRLIAGIGDILQRALGRGIALRQSLASDAWPVFCDPHQIETALLNLAFNARDAMPDGGVLTVATANARFAADAVASHGEPVRAGDYVMMTVTDTGSGIPPEIVDRIFEPFFSTKEVGKGTGLGLSQVYGFVKQSGGHIRVSSEVGAGTRVELYLPRSPEREIGEPSPAAAVGPQPLRPTVLVVEDDPGVREFAVEVLNELGYRIIEAVDGREALRLLREDADKVDLLFTDVMMPGPNGFQVAEEALALRPQLKVLFASGYAADVLPPQQRFEWRLLAKPYRPADLAREVRALLAAE